MKKKDTERVKKKIPFAIVEYTFIQKQKQDIVVYLHTLHLSIYPSTYIYCRIYRVYTRKLKEKSTKKKQINERNCQAFGQG